MRTANPRIRVWAVPPWCGTLSPSRCAPRLRIRAWEAAVNGRRANGTRTESCDPEASLSDATQMRLDEQGEMLAIVSLVPLGSERA